MVGASARWARSGVTAERSLAAGPYDAVILWDALFHIERRYHRRILEWVGRCLRSGGRVMLTVGGSADRPFTDTMFGREFYYDSYPPREVLTLLSNLKLAPVVHEFMERPTGGRNKGRYAVVAEKVWDRAAGDEDRDAQLGVVRTP